MGKLRTIYLFVDIQFKGCHKKGEKRGGRWYVLLRHHYTSINRVVVAPLVNDSCQTRRISYELDKAVRLKETGHQR